MTNQKFMIRGAVAEMELEEEFNRQLEILKLARDKAAEHGKKEESGFYLALAYMALEVAE